jgi:hypothetical protein
MLAAMQFLGLFSCTHCLLFRCHRGSGLLVEEEEEDMKKEEDIWAMVYE